MHFIDVEADDILISMNLNPVKMAEYGGVPSALKRHFKVRGNIIYEKAKFHRRS